MRRENPNGGAFFQRRGGAGMKFRSLWMVAAAAAVVCGAPAAVAQSWPTKPVIMVVPFPPGGGTDAFARPLAATLTKQLGKQVIIDNRGGAGGNLGASI